MSAFEAVSNRPTVPQQERRRLLVASIALLVGFGGLGVRLGELAARNSGIERINVVRTVGQNWSRPELTDRQGRILATDISVPSAFADPSALPDVDEAVDQLLTVLPEMKRADLTARLRDRRKKFVWIKRALHPSAAQRVHDLGLPGVGFRHELRRVYPNGRLGRHVLGQVDIDNRGLNGMERFLDRTGLTEHVDGPVINGQAPVKLSIDIGVQHALEQELRDGQRRYGAKSAAGFVMDVRSGEMLAYGSETSAGEGDDLGDRLNAAVFELGSVFKPLTIATALDAGLLTRSSRFDARNPIVIGASKISDLHPQRQLLSVQDILLKSSNIGTAKIADVIGLKLQTEYFRRLGLLSAVETELGVSAAPLLPKPLNRLSGMTAAFGHGIAVAPLVFGRAAAATVNGGDLVTPTFLAASEHKTALPSTRVITRETSEVVRRMMWANVESNSGTGARARVAGLRIGGKTGTAEMPSAQGYQKKRVIASFVGAFPSEAPRYLTYVLLFEPTGSSETGGAISAGRNAAPMSGRLIERIAPILGVAVSPTRARTF